MFIFMEVFFLLNITLLMANFIDPRCFWRINLDEIMDEYLGLSCAFILAAVQTPIENDYFNKTLNVLKTTKNHKYALALVFAMDEINRNPDLLPNMSLIIRYTLGRCDGKTVIPTPYLFRKKKESPIPNYFCNEETMCSYLLTGPHWEVSLGFWKHMNSFLSPRILQLTYGPFHSIFSDDEQYPYLYQMAPKDTSLALAMVSFILYFSWNWIGLVIPDDDQGNQFLLELKKQSENKEICFAFVKMISVDDVSFPQNTEMYYNQIVMSSTNVIIIYGETYNFIDLIFRMWEPPILQRIWITTKQLNFPTRKKDISHGTFYGSLTFLPHHGVISGFKNFVQTWFHLRNTDLYLVMQEWKYFNYEDSASTCKILKNNSSNASFDWLMEQKFDMTFSENSHNIYNAVHAIAHALHEMNLQQADNQAIDNGKGASSHCLKVNSFLRRIYFTNPPGDKVFMKQRVIMHDEYDIVHFVNLSQHLGIKMKLGKFSPYLPHGRHSHLYVDRIELATGRRKMPSSVCSADCSPGFRRLWKEGMAACCFVCSPCPENEISNETTVVLCVFVKHHDTPIVKANNRSLSYLLLMSLMSCFLCSFFFIGLPNRAICVLQQITFGIVFTMAVSTVLAKTVTVVLAFKVTDPGRRLRNFLVSGTPNYIIPICSLLQCVLCAIWLAVSPPFVDIDEHTLHGHIIIVCNKGSVTAFYCILGYLACLALGNFSVAFLAKNLPDTFNEAKFLTFSMLVFCSVWVTFLPVYHSTKGKHMVAVEIFSILASSAGILGCIFVPKIYIILMRPERNSTQKIREKSYF
ncbi:vomeronasal 2, receptor, 14 precursor [Mus musculus]|uniref:Vomeronasal 2, receptor 37 n=1 Tax=Mus musculus TaxID=10090 RepID=F8VQD3_MOUSE|nr:vomeronasal 2, receptor, 14 precursor [Mus musculus]AAI56793.1 Vomeronasal 2, receptor 37 [synthetic construct]|eukprot:NP_033515.2 vomeronasal 2, receptor, 14 precursor [Mus musculus]